MSSNTKTLTALGRTTLNPNAKEFIPTAFRSSSSFATAGTAEESKVLTVENSGKAALDRTSSSNSSTSDEECRRYWHSQLPDDIITPDLDFLGQAPNDTFETAESVTRASGLDHVNASSISVKCNDSVTRNIQLEGMPFNRRQQQSISQGTDYDSDSRFAVIQHIEQVPDTSVRAFTGRSLWEHRHAVSSDQLLSSGNRDGQLLNGGSGINFLTELVGERSFLEDLGDIDPVDLLANEFPGFAAQSLADIYHANGGDLSLTIEMLTQLELQEDGGPQGHLQSQLSSSPNLKLMDFPALSRPDLVNGLSQFLEDGDMQQPAGIQNVVEAERFLMNMSGAHGHPTAVRDFAAVVRKNAAQLHFDRNGALDFSRGSSRFSSQNLGLGPFAGDSRVSNGDRFEHLSHTGRTHRLPSQIWLETGDAVASIYSELREEARDHARVRNAYFEQARQAYLVGNKALAKEASAKGQLHNRLMKTAHSKAGEAIFQQRNLSPAQGQGFGLGQPRLLDLHGLHVNEAIPLLKRELSALRVAARSTRQRQQVFICVGTGHHTKGSRTPARLPLAVERYLAEDEHLHFTESQPGMIKVVLS